MGKDSKISWTNHTFNPFRGCTKVHTGCANCYAERDSHRFPAIRGVWGPNGTRVMASADMWSQPIKWNRQAAKEEVRCRVFCASLADVFEQWDGPIVDHNGDRLWELYQPSGTYVTDTGGHDDKRPVTMDMLRAKLFALIDETPWLDWLLVTKRPENIRRMWVNNGLMAATEKARGGPNPSGLRSYRHNVWLLTSVSNQETADAMIPHLLKCRDLAPVLGLSAEPLLGPIEFSNVTKRSDAVHQLGKKALSGIDWVILGGESGSNARACDIGWIRSIRDQCKNVDVACFIKQLGSNVEWSGIQGGYMDGVPDVWPNEGHNIDTRRGNWRKILIDKKGGDWEEWPMDLRVREYPFFN